MASNRDFDFYKVARRFAKEKEFAAELCAEEQNYQNSDFISNGRNSQYRRNFQPEFNRERNANYRDRNFGFLQRNFDIFKEISIFKETEMYRNTYCTVFQYYC